MAGRPDRRPCWGPRNRRTLKVRPTGAGVDVDLDPGALGVETRSERTVSPDAIGSANGRPRADDPRKEVRARPVCKPLRSGNDRITQQVCKLEIWNDPAGHGAAWIGTRRDVRPGRDGDAPVGRYRVRLGVSWKSGTTSRSGTVEILYEVRLVMPPFKIAMTPPLSAPEGAAVKIKPLVTRDASISQGCKIEVWPEGQARAVWASTTDPGCSREDTVNLPSGRYVVKLTAGYFPGGGAPGRSTTVETPYEITAGEKLMMSKCTFSTPSPMAGRPMDVSWEVRNVSTFPLGPFPVSVVVGHEAVDNFTVATLAAGATVSRTATFTPRSAGRIHTGR